MGLLCTLVLTSCRQTSPEVKPLTGPPQVGALYSFNDGEGGFRAGKIIALDDEAIFVRLFENRWTARPTLAAARQAGTPIPLAYSTQTFAGMQPVHLENGTVAADELEDYETWKQSKRDVF